MSRDLQDPLRQQIRAVRIKDIVGIRKTASFSRTLLIRALINSPIDILRSMAAVFSFATPTSVPKSASFTRVLNEREQVNSYEDFTGNFSAVSALSTPTDVPFDTSGTFTSTPSVVST